MGLNCVYLRQLDIYQSSRKVRQDADEQTCVFNTFLPALSLWVSEQHLHLAEAVLICSNQLLVVDMQRGEHHAATRHSWALHSPARGAMKKPPQRNLWVSLGCRLYVQEIVAWYLE